MKKFSLFLVLLSCLFLNVAVAKAEPCSSITDSDKKNICLTCVNACPKGNETAYNECSKSCQNKAGQSQATETGPCKDITDEAKHTQCLNCIISCGNKYDKNTTQYNECSKSCQNKAGQSQAKDPAAAQEEWAENYVGNYVKCGNSGAIPDALPKLSRMLILLIQILVPIALIILGSIDFAKAVASSDADFLDKAKKKFMRRVIAAVAIFFVFVIVKTVIGNFSSDTGATECLKCFINKASACHPATYDGEISNALYDE